MTCEQTSIASGQRPTKRQPSGRVDGGGGETLAHLDALALAKPRVGHGREQQPRVRMQRIGEHLLDRALLDDLPRVHHEDVVGDVARAREVVRDVEERDPPLLLQLQHQVQDPDPDRDVEHARRLVGEQHDRLDGERPRDRDALPLAARELVRVLRRDVLGRHEPDRAQQVVDALLELVALDDPVDLQRPLDVVADRLHRVQRAERILEDHLNLRAVAESARRPRSPLTSLPSKSTDAAVGS